MKDTTNIGNRAEEAVAEQLVRDGYQILDRNWKTSFAEIDIVAQKGGALYFVEVKYRKTLSAGDGFDYITVQKLRHMRRAAEAFVVQTGWRGEYLLLAASAIGGMDRLDIQIIDV